MSKMLITGQYTAAPEFVDGGVRRYRASPRARYQYKLYPTDHSADSLAAFPSPQPIGSVHFCVWKGTIPGLGALGLNVFSKLDSCQILQQLLQDRGGSRRGGLVLKFDGPER